MPPKTKEEMKEYNRHLYLKRKERKQNAVVSVSLSEPVPKSPIELVITELPMPVPMPFQPPTPTQPPIQIQSNTISNMEDIMRELMMELFEEEETKIEDEIIEGTIKYIYYKLYLKIHKFQKMHKKELPNDYRLWIQRWREVNKEIYENHL
jgi:hypothetical protein